MEDPLHNKEVINLTSFRSQYAVSLALSGGDSHRYAIEENGGYDLNGGVTPRGSAVLSGYDTLDSPPSYDFYANTEVYGRTKKIRPSLFQLHTNHEVGGTGLDFARFMAWIIMNNIGSVLSMIKFEFVNCGFM